jgi:hypothetical protein
MSKNNTEHGDDRDKICKCGHSKELHDPSSGVCNAYIAPDIVCPCMKYVEKVKKDSFNSSIRSSSKKINLVI